jgi:hypothetical protein
MGVGAAERIRTFDRLVNSQPLYRAEPRRHNNPCMHSQFQKDYLRIIIHFQRKNFPQPNSPKRHTQKMPKNFKHLSPKHHHFCATKRTYNTYIR